MIHSMTGFGKASGTYESKKIRIELKSLNSKSLDLYVRMPHIYKEKEIGLRKIIGAALDRGKVECNIFVEADGEVKTGALNKVAIRSYFSELKDIQTEFGIASGEALGSILRLPDVFTTPTEELDEKEWSFVNGLVQKAVENLDSFREDEGLALKTEFELRIGNIGKMLTEIPQFEKERIVEIKARIENNIQDFLTSTKVDKSRFEQELIYYIEKIDISEEKQRLGKHLEYFIETLNGQKSNGKKLGFIGQEIGREINTLGSKSYHLEMQKRVVQMKDELEKIKEQVLNTL